MYVCRHISIYTYMYMCMYVCTHHGCTGSSWHRAQGWPHTYTLSRHKNFCLLRLDRNRTRRKISSEAEVCQFRLLVPNFYQNFHLVLVQLSLIFVCMVPQPFQPVHLWYVLYMYLCMFTHSHTFTKQLHYFTSDMTLFFFL